MLKITSPPDDVIVNAVNYSTIINIKPAFYCLAVYDLTSQA